MSECKIILPQLPEEVDAVTIAKTFQYTRKELCDVFGGYTETDGDGGWMDAEGNLIVDKVTVFTCAILPRAGLYGYSPRQNTLCGDKLREIATSVRERLKQDCVYIRHGSGTVELI